MDQFQQNYYSDYKSKIAYQSWCKQCKKEDAAQRPYNPITARRQSLKNKFGISLEQYEEMLADQGGGCKICGTRKVGGRSKGNFHVDHCHETGRVRGLLCHKCNTGLGCFGDAQQLLWKAAAYIGSAQLPALPLDALARA